MNKHFLLKDLMLYFPYACEERSCEEDSARDSEVKRQVRVEGEPYPFQ